MTAAIAATVHSAFSAAIYRSSIFLFFFVWLFFNYYYLFLNSQQPWQAAGSIHLAFLPHLNCAAALEKIMVLMVQQL